MKASLKRYFLITALLVIMGCTKKNENLSSCEMMKIRGWGDVLVLSPFRDLTNYQATPVEPLSEKSRLSLSDSAYEYTLLLNFHFAYPGGQKSRLTIGNRCISDVDLLVSYPSSEISATAFASFLSFMASHQVPNLIIEKIGIVFKDGLKYGLVGEYDGLKIYAGVVEHRFRGNFFLIDIKSKS